MEGKTYWADYVIWDKGQRKIKAAATKQLDVYIQMKHTIPTTVLLSSTICKQQIVLTFVVILHAVST